MKNKALKIVLIVLGVILGIAGILAIVWFGFLNPYRGTVEYYENSLPLEQVLTREQALEDLDYAIGKLQERHPAWLEEQNDGVDAVMAQYETERNQMPENPTVLDLWRAVSRCFSVMHDGHTEVWASPSDPLYINSFQKIREKGKPDYINGEPIEDVYARFLTLSSYELEPYADALFLGNVMINKAYLTWIGVDTTDGVTFTYETEDGPVDDFYTFVPVTEIEGYDSEAEADWVGYEIDEANHIGIFTLKSCEYNDEYRSTVKAFFEAVSEQGVTDVIVDLRGNGGGSSLVCDEFLKYMDLDSYYSWANDIRLGNHLLHNKRSLMKNHRQNPQFSGDLYVLSNTKSFSAAMDFIMVVLDNGIGTIVGEAPGNLPDSYGDILKFSLPNSKLSMQVSYKRWYRVDESKAGELLEPNVPCPSEEAMDEAYQLILTNRP
jgi:hypothetical protein